MCCSASTGLSSVCFRRFHYSFCRKGVSLLTRILLVAGSWHYTCTSWTIWTLAILEMDMFLEYCCTQAIQGHFQLEGGATKCLALTALAYCLLLQKKYDIFLVEIPSFTHSPLQLVCEKSCDGV